MSASFILHTLVHNMPTNMVQRMHLPRIFWCVTPKPRTLRALLGCLGPSKVPNIEEMHGRLCLSDAVLVFLPRSTYSTCRSRVMFVLDSSVLLRCAAMVLFAASSCMPTVSTRAWIAATAPSFFGSSCSSCVQETDGTQRRRWAGRRSSHEKMNASTHVSRQAPAVLGQWASSSSLVAQELNLWLARRDGRSCATLIALAPQRDSHEFNCHRLCVLM